MKNSFCGRELQLACSSPAFPSGNSHNVLPLHHLLPLHYSDTRGFYSVLQPVRVSVVVLFSNLAIKLEAFSQPSLKQDCWPTKECCFFFISAGKQGLCAAWE